MTGFEFLLIGVFIGIGYWEIVSQIAKKRMRRR